MSSVVGKVKVVSRISVDPPVCTDRAVHPAGTGLSTGAGFVLGHTPAPIHPMVANRLGDALDWSPAAVEPLFRHGCSAAGKLPVGAFLSAHLALLSTRHLWRRQRDGLVAGVERSNTPGLVWFGHGAAGAAARVGWAGAGGWPGWPMGCLATWSHAAGFLSINAAAAWLPWVILSLTMVLEAEEQREKGAHLYSWWFAWRCNYYPGMPRRPGIPVCWLACGQLFAGLLCGKPVRVAGCGTTPSCWRWRSCWRWVWRRSSCCPPPSISLNPNAHRPSSSITP